MGHELGILALDVFDQPGAEVHQHIHAQIFGPITVLLIELDDFLDEDNVVKFAQNNKIQFSTYKDLTADPMINKLILKEVNAVNETLARVENI